MNTPAPTAAPASTALAESIAIAQPTATPVASTTPVRELIGMRDVLDGSLHLPADADWDAARTAWNLAVDQRPAAVVIAGSARDVVLTVNAARELGLRVAPQSTGHNAAPLGGPDGLAGTILLRTSSLRGVSIVPESRIARCESGALWADVTTPAAAFGLAALAGSSADVGIAGYLLGGGVSWLARSHGLAVNSITAIEIVTADGLLRRIDADHEPELFWAVRGGSGNFGIVTAIELRLFPMTEVYAGTLFFPLAEASRVLQAWREWTADVPEQVTSVGRILQFPPLPELPDFLRGQSYVVIEAALQAPPVDADAVLAPLRDLDPVIDTFQPTPMTELDQLHMDPQGPVPGVGDGFALAELTADAVEAFVAAAGAGSGSALLSAEIRHVGGAAGRAPRGAGVVSHLDSEFLVFGAGIAATPEMGVAAAASVDRLAEALVPWRAAVLYQNFAEGPQEPRAIWGADLDRLRAIKVVYDPSNTIRSNHPVL
ncbi:MAG: FAD-binding oxidoreductase [Leifsonia flava]